MQKFIEIYIWRYIFRNLNGTYMENTWNFKENQDIEYIYLFDIQMVYFYQIITWRNRLKIEGVI